jgi:hypothetical protein
MACLVRWIDAVTSIPMEVPMRIPALVILAALTVLASVPASAQTYGGNYPVCIQNYRWGGSDIDCRFTSMGQCAASASGRAAQCLVNPYYANAQMPRGSSRRAY